MKLDFPPRFGAPELMARRRDAPGKCREFNRKKILPQKSNELIPKIAMFKGSYLFQPIILGIHVSFREDIAPVGTVLSQGWLGMFA